MSSRLSHKNKNVKSSNRTKPIKAGNRTQQKSDYDLLITSYNINMLFDYFYWQFAAGPQWLITVSWNFQKALWQFFSIRVMLRTLIAHWHKDVMVFKGGLENLAMSVIWNQISRAIGFIIRSAVIITWLIAVGISVPLSALLVVVFIAWPLIVILALATGAALFIV